mmetsp:Transcript_15418/g.39733  ORF Transcript_15418/g.39733 Transcript_15418/m.39733 type:complete len:147 (+) Transcript_15418:54-494(+)|eukprot:CAMPEP_0115863590 /NCGR_PEP_ID=MMETSP0287-20121206/18766_1 /TAXON_ID=412157 /ORGANISM="Chrysochromulina rotalis, Strain UIO044" /LENGTH=146 /DNA_ID=CAMNT_0003318039 /DNA_START=32 /DNA_END=472 /DNA_ORIENTATION=-
MEVDDAAPRSIAKPDGRVIELATRAAMKVAFRAGARVLDVRDPNEVEASKGGTSVSGNARVHAPVNTDGKTQKEHNTSLPEYREKLVAAGVDVDQAESQVFVVHCTGGGRADKGAGFLRELGFTALNGGGPDDVRTCFEEVAAATH